MMLRVANLSASYGAVRVIENITFDIGQGEVVAMLGRNGVGKSTTIKALMGLVAREGAIGFEETDISQIPPYRIARLGLGYVPEDRRIFTDLTVRENLDVGRQPARDSAVWNEERVFALFPQLAGMAERRASEMSGGEQQMLTVGRTLMGNPRLILLDEPSEGIAPIIVEQMADAILDMKAMGVAILLAEQNLNFAALVADRAMVLEKGEIRWQGAMDVLMADEALQRRYLTV